MKRIGLGKGKGKGYKNLIPIRDKKVHHDSGRGIKQPQRIPNIPQYYIKTADINNSPNDLRYKNEGIYMTDEIGGKQLDYFMQEELDLTNHKDYEYVTNQKLNGKDVGVLFLMSRLGIGRWSTSLGLRGFSKTSDKELSKGNYELFDEKDNSMVEKTKKAYYEGKPIDIAWKVNNKYTQIVYNDSGAGHEDVLTKDIEWRED